MHNVATALRDIWKDNPHEQTDTSPDSDRSANRCVDCKAAAPQTNTNYTLISSQYGWRLTFAHDENGRRVPEWRCPKCWKAHKRRDQH